jgi:hypothetical protein
LSEDQKQQLDPNFSEELNFDDWNAEDVGGDVYSGDGREEARGGHSNNARGRGVRRGRSSRGASLEASNQKQQLDPNFSEELDFDDWNVDDLGGDVYSGDGQEEARGGHSNIARGRGVRRGRGGRGASLEASNPGQVRGRGRGRGRPRGRGRGTDK